MDFAFNEDQNTIKRTAREFLAARYNSEAIRRLADDGRGFTDEQWSELAGLGWPGIFVSESDGGQGLGVLELAILQEELGYALAPTPFFSTVAAGLVLQAAAEDDQRQRFLAPVAAGDLRAVLAVEGNVTSDDDGSVTGKAVVVPDAGSADFLVVAVGERGPDSEAGGMDHYVVHTDAEGVSITPTPGLDPTRKLHEVAFEKAPGERLGGDASSAYPKVVTALAAESTGVSQRAMEMAVEYAKDRKQFGTPIGAFQAISHKCAEMLMYTEGARSASYYAAWCLDHEPHSGPLAASMAKAYASDGATKAVASALQVHGGIGFTWEHDIHFFLKRAQANARTFGDAGWHRARVADLTGV